ncbi:hypothetical protein [Reticulibacter mediterranei]|uniref:hypothetical protein n=1 Tax=Reticulibacter mediterranei TaxID=2778369 RepID=UPI001C690002|nr:hypothetical protein [Reticulibacter mediterranei]
MFVPQPSGAESLGIAVAQPRHRSVDPEAVDLAQQVVQVLEVLLQEPVARDQNDALPLDLERQRLPDGPGNNFDCDAGLAVGELHSFSFGAYRDRLVLFPQPVPAHAAQPTGNYRGGEPLPFMVALTIEKS